jgi:hypothetical protein
MKEKDWNNLQTKKISPKKSLKLFLTYKTRMHDTKLPENCVFRAENVIDFAESLYINTDIKLKYYSEERPDKFWRKLLDEIERFCEKGRLRSIIINKTQYYEATPQFTKQSTNHSRDLN